MIKIDFSEEEIRNLHVLCTHPHPVVQKRALILLLKSENIPHHKIVRIADVCENTVRTCFTLYQAGGVEQIQAMNYYKPQSSLKPFEDIVRKYFTETPPCTMAQVCTAIEKLTDVKIGKTQLRKFVKSLGIHWRKVNSVPAKANIEEQKKYHDGKLQPRLDEVREGKRAVFFVDAAHFVLGAFLGYLWSFVRVFVRTPSGRKRFNVLGALNAITKEIVTITNDTYITSIQVCELLDKITSCTTTPITIVLDNAPYQRCALVINHAMKLNIELLFLPPYSPNLNLIERLWKLVKKECLHSVYYENFTKFHQSIEIFLNTINDTHQKKLDSLLTLNFQEFTEDQMKYAA